MNLKEEIFKDYSKQKVKELSEYIGNDKVRFAEIMELFFSEDSRINQRASWVVGHCADLQPDLFSPYLERMIKNLDNPVHDAVVRNTMRIFQDTEIPEPLMGEVADKAFNYLTNPQIPVAIRAFSMTVLYNITLIWPELQHELKAIIEEHLPFGSAGFKSRGKKILRNLEKLGAST